MEIKDVKEGLKVVARIQVDGKPIDNAVCEVITVFRADKITLRHILADGNELYFALSCADFEPYEEPKEEVAKLKVDEFLNGNTNKGYAINLDALENFGINIETGKKITPKEVLDLFVERGIVIREQSEYTLPITQEFIESFGFVLAKKISKDSCRYTKEVSGGKVELYQSAGCYSVDLLKEISVMCIASRYKCTTQSELRFLLTKGRIDCTK